MPPAITAAIAFAGALSLRIKHTKNCPSVNSGTANFSHLRYPLASGRSVSFAPNSLKRGVSKKTSSAHTVTVTTATQKKARVNKTSPRCLSPSPRALDINTPPPTPNNSPRLKIIVQMGMTTDSAALPSEPSYCPTMMASTRE